MSFNLMTTTAINKGNEVTGTVNPHSLHNIDYNCFMSVIYFVHFQGTMCSDCNYEIPILVFAVT